MAFMENKLKDRFNAFQLTGSENYESWNKKLQAHMFKKIHNINMDNLKTVQTLDPSYFKSHFSDGFKAASKDANNRNVNPMEDTDFVLQCTDHAFSTGEGFHDWLYILYSDVRTSLSDDIQDQTDGVQLGDLVTLLHSIKLAVHCAELSNPYDLEIEYTRSTMETTGNNDLMTFLAKLTHYLRRLKAVNLPQGDLKAMRVLLNGLHQDIFESFISTTKRTPYETYAALQKALEETASEPRMMAKLAALKPGKAHSTFTTQTGNVNNGSQGPTEEKTRIDYLEAAVMSMKQQQQQHNYEFKGTKEKCKLFALNGKCMYGPNCRYSHSIDKSDLWCEHHRRAGTHNTADCRLGRPFTREDHNKNQNSPGTSIRSSEGQHGHQKVTTTTHADHNDHEIVDDIFRGYSFCF
jgi:hypothetical protein